MRDSVQAAGARPVTTAYSAAHSLSLSAAAAYPKLPSCPGLQTPAASSQQTASSPGGRQFAAAAVTVDWGPGDSILRLRSAAGLTVTAGAPRSSQIGSSAGRRGQLRVIRLGEASSQPGVMEGRPRPGRAGPRAGRGSTDHRMWDLVTATH
eukprot:183947-Hanusia_phi.AAC.1